MKKITVEIILELDGGQISAWCKLPELFASTIGNSKEEVTKEIVNQIIDHYAETGQTLKESDFEITYSYDLMAFFEEFKAFKINAIAEHAGINPNLLHQYAKGHKSASSEKVKQIQEAIQSLAKIYSNVQLQY